MTLSIEEYSNLKGWTTSRDLDLGQIIVGVLERELGNERADEVLAALDRAVSPAALAVQREVDAEVKKIKAAQKKVADKLADTTGIKFATWGMGHYLVTFDGEPIGSIHPHTRKYVNGRQSFSDWIPSPTPWSTMPYDGKPCRTRDEASVVVWDWWTRRQRVEQERTRS